MPLAAYGLMKVGRFDPDMNLHYYRLLIFGRDLCR
jgi:hypothetical protein